jgi:hypothetical protein
MGRSLPYTLGVGGRRKMAATYCQSVLSHDQRIALDGSPAETVDAAEAKKLAAKQAGESCHTQGNEAEARGAGGGETDACPGAAT